jgi:hypothetical protein
MDDRRTAVRQRSFLRGCVYFNHRRSAADCLIRDISEQGARLVFSDTVVIPDIVDLYVPQKEETLRARVQWRHGTEIGVAFVGKDAGIEAEPVGVGARLAALEAEVAALRRIIKRLQAELRGDTEAA